MLFLFQTSDWTIQIFHTLWDQDQESSHGGEHNKADDGISLTEGFLVRSGRLPEEDGKEGQGQT